MPEPPSHDAIRAMRLVDNEYHRGADFDGDDPAKSAYRYRLWRWWSDAGITVNFIMLNPSTADADRDDPTIRKCIMFARSWGAGRLFVTNLFGLRSTDPKGLIKHDDPIGPRNDAFLDTEAQEADLVVCAWGNHGWRRGQSSIVCYRLERLGAKLHHLGLTKQDQPKHPLYLPNATKLQPWN